MSETPRFCICLTPEGETSPERTRQVFHDLVDYFFLGEEKENPGNPIPLVVAPIALKSIGLLLRSGLVEETAKLITEALREKS